MAETHVSRNSAGTYDITHLNQYGTNITEPITNIPGYNQLGLDASDTESFHDYNMVSIVGNVHNFGGETIEDAFEALTKTPAPFASSYKGFVTGSIANVKGLGPVTFSVDPFDFR